MISSKYTHRGIYQQRGDKVIFLKKLFSLSIKNIDVTELQRLLDKNIVLLDVRTAQEYARGHIKGARSYPLDRLNTYQGSKDKPIYLICHSGARSKRGAKLLQQKGYEAISVKGGMMAWHRKIIGGNK